MIDQFLNKITMYRLVLYVVFGLLGIAFIFGALGILPHGPIEILFSSLVIFLSCAAVNYVLAKLFRAPTNWESVYITVGILALIISPIRQLSDIPFLLWASLFAMASKYFLAVGKKHIFNPAAIAVVITAFVFNQSAIWWVGTLSMLPFVLVGGLLITRKIHRFDLVLSFAATALVTIVAFSWTRSSPQVIIWKAISDAPLAFFSLIMLTEPLTTPPTRPLRMAYGALVGFLYAPAIHIGSVYSTPELALVAGNLFSYLVSPKIKYLLTLKEKVPMGKDMYDFVFTSTKPMKFEAGQYMEWTLAHGGPDNRGIRRYFTLASSPTEADPIMGIKFYEPSSSYKKALSALQPGDKIVASQLAGDFTFPKDKKRKVAFLAGGIGITPFRSMIKQALDRKEQRSMVLLYSNKTADEIAYRDIFDQAEKELGMKAIYFVTNEEMASNDPHIQCCRLDASLLVKEVPDYRERLFYISGPHAMVTAFEKLLGDMGVPRTQIKIDYFPGFA